MATLTLHFATNRKHEGVHQEKPKRYGKDPSSDGGENLRFGSVALKDVVVSKVKTLLNEDVGYGIGNGVGLSAYLLTLINANKSSIKAYTDNLLKTKPDVAQASKMKKLGSITTFKSLQSKMKKSSDVLIYIHGFNVSWEESVAAALALQISLNQSVVEGKNNIVVVLFTWPSDGSAVPIYSYKSDRSDAEFSGASFGRGLLKFRDFLVKLPTRKKLDTKKHVGELQCKREIHLLCHSMGNYVLQNTIKRMVEFNHGIRLPRLFDHIFLCSPDVDDDVLETDQPLGKLAETARSISMYHNSGDVAMYVSDYTKQNPDRLGLNGAANPSRLNQKIHQINCSDIVSGLVEHSYYLDGNVNLDIRQSLQGSKHDDVNRNRTVSNNAWPNQWVLKKD